LDGEAAYTLVDMGFGRLAGMTDTLWHPMESGFQSFEQVCDGKPYAGVDEARVSSQVGAGDCLEIRYDADRDALDALDLYLPNAPEAGIQERDKGNPVPHPAPIQRKGKHATLASGLGALSVKMLTY
jgi:hypothetical protein